MESIVFHIDVNSAFLSWTAVKLLSEGYPYDIRTKVAVIGGDESKRSGIITAASIPAKKLGIHVPDPLFKVRKIYPNVLILPGDYKLYETMSNKLFNHIKTYSPDVEIASIDECYLDYGKVKRLYGDEIKFAHKLKDEIYKKFGFTVNIGIGNNKLCAKMASDFEKPNKVHTLYSYEVKDKMYPLPIGDLFGIGKQTVPKLIALGINTIGDLATYDLDKLTKIFKNQAMYMHEIANGIRYDAVDSSERIPKGLGHEITLPSDEHDINKLNHYLQLLSEMVGSRIRREGMYSDVIVVVIKDNFFKRRSHQKKIKNGTNVTSEIYKIAKEVLLEFYNGEEVRLIGIRLDNLKSSITYQSSIFDNDKKNSKEREMDKVIDVLNSKYGRNTILPASLIETQKK